MRKTVGGITFNDRDDFLLSKEEINEFLERHKEDLKNNNWDKIFEGAEFNGKTNRFSFYKHFLIYTLLSLGSDFMTYTSEIPAYLFHNCVFITSITLPSSIKKIGDHAFHGCVSLKSIVIPNSTVLIGDEILYACESLTEVTLPKALYDDQLVLGIGVKVKTILK